MTEYNPERVKAQVDEMLKRFGSAMQEKMMLNLHKGTSWRDSTFHYLWDKFIDEEQEELEAAVADSELYSLSLAISKEVNDWQYYDDLRKSLFSGSPPIEQLDALQEELADKGNMLMMMWDWIEMMRIGLDR